MWLWWVGETSQVTVFRDPVHDKGGLERGYEQVRTGDDDMWHLMHGS